MRTSFCTVGRKIAPTWNCSQQSVQIMLSNWVMMYGKRHRCWVFWAIEFYHTSYRRDEADTSTADISKTWQLTPKQSRWINSPTGERKICIYDWGWTVTVSMRVSSFILYEGLWCTDSNREQSKFKTFNIHFIGLVFWVQWLFLPFWHSQTKQT